MRRVFISYSSDDRAAVSGLVQHLEAAGLDVWFDQEISGGQAWWPTILEHLRSAEVVVAMVTGASVASNACRSEVSYAHALGKTVIPVRLGALGPDDAPAALQELQWIDYRRPTVEIALALVRAIYHAPEVALPVPLPPAPPAPPSYAAQTGGRPPVVPAPTRRGPRTALVVWLAAAAVVLAAVIIGSLGGDGEGAAADTTEAPPDTLGTAFADTTATETTVAETTVTDTVAPTPPDIETVEVVVPGTEAATDTGVYLRAGDVVTLEAGGAIVHDISTGGSADPIGDPNPDLVRFNVVAEAPHGALLYRIGADAPPFAVGWYLEVTVEQDGELFLGPNDLGVDNNDGAFTVTVGVTRAG